MNVIAIIFTPAQLATGMAARDALGADRAVMVALQPGALKLGETVQPVVLLTPDCADGPMRTCIEALRQGAVAPVFWSFEGPADLVFEGAARIPGGLAGAGAVRAALAAQQAQGQTRAVYPPPAKAPSVAAMVAGVGALCAAGWAIHLLGHVEPASANAQERHSPAPLGDLRSTLPEESRAAK